MGLLGHEDRVGSRRHGGRHGEIARLPPHDLDDERPMVGAGSVGDVVACLDDRVEGTVDTERFTCQPDVVVDRGRDADDGDIGLFDQRVETGHRPVAPYDDHTCDRVLLQLLHRRGPRLPLEESLAPARAQHGPAFTALYLDLMQGSRCPSLATTHQRAELPVDETVVPVLDTPRGDPVGGGDLGHGSYRGIHPRGIATGCQDGKCGHEANGNREPSRLVRYAGCVAEDSASDRSATGFGGTMRTFLRVSRSPQ